MNEHIILKMAEPYIKDSALTYEDFEKIYSILSLKEKYAVVEVLYKNGINLIGEEEQLEDDEFILDLNSETAKEDEEVLYDDSIFKDSGEELPDELTVNKEVKQSNEVLCALIQQGNKQAVQDLCVKNKRLVDKFVCGYQKKYRHNLEFEDLEQAGFLGLIKGAERYDITVGAAFSTYVVTWIKQSITREIMNTGYTIRIPVHMMERIVKVVALDNKYNTLNAADRMAQISKETGLTDEQIRECYFLESSVLKNASLNTTVGEEEQSELEEFIPDNVSTSVEKIIENKDLRNHLEEILTGLSEKEQQVIRLRFGFDDGVPKTLEAVGEMFGVTRERIRQIEAKALMHMRSARARRKIKDFLE